MSDAGFSISDLQLPDLSADFSDLSLPQSQLDEGLGSGFISSPTSILQGPTGPVPLSSQQILGTTPTAASSFNAVTNAPAGSSGLTFNDLNAVAGAVSSLARTGVQTYATVDQINAGNSLPYAYAAGTGAPLYNPEAVLPAGGVLPTGVLPTTPFSIASLTDFTTPYPYLLGGGGLLLLVLLARPKKKGK